MKSLIVGINASYSHTCLGGRDIFAYVSGRMADERGESNIDYKEFTINQPYGDVLRGIGESGAQVVLFCTYIWNAEMICKLIPDVKKVLPGVLIGAGGPEFGFAAQKYLTLLPDLDFIVKGEGEKIIYNLQLVISNYGGKLDDVKGLYLRDANKNIKFTGEADLICDLSELRFPYPELLKHNTETSNNYYLNKLFYYESSRGCPYACAYCLSSVDKRVRFMPLERVFADLQIFMDAGVPIVKFVDRTYNLQPERYIAIWKYILEHHNGKTMFHFEIEAEHLSEEALEFLQKVPAGVMQFEIGVQSANKKTLQAVNRSVNVEKLAENVKRIPRTIHQHLDLIAGLPYEDLESFGHSFDFVMSLKPDELQLGFLKVLPGTQMEKFALENGWQWMNLPVYETFSTPYMSYQDMMFLKDVEVLVDAFWNSGHFAHIMKYFGRTLGFWCFFSSLVPKARAAGAFESPRRDVYWFEFLAKEYAENPLILDLLKYDFILRGKQGNFPAWYKHIYDKNRHWELLEQNGGIKNPRTDFLKSEYEVFEFDVDAEEPEKFAGKWEKVVWYRE